MSSHPEAIDIIYSTIMAELAQRCESDEELMNAPGASASPADEKQNEARQKLVNILCREGALPRIPETVGSLLANLAKRGAFRRGGVLLEGPLPMAYAAYFCVTLPRGSATTREETDIAIGFLGAASRHGLDASAALVEESAEAHGEPMREAAKVYRLTRDPSQRYFARQTSVFPSEVIKYLLEEPVKAVLLCQAGSIIRLPPPERYVIASLISANAGIGDSEIDWMINAIILRRQQAEIVLALKDAIAQHPVWQTVIQQSLARLPSDLREKIIEVCRNGGAIFGDARSVLMVLGVDKS